MFVCYKSKKLERLCTISYETQKKYDKEMADKIHQRIDEIKVSENVEILVQYRIGRCHP